MRMKPPLEPGPDRCCKRPCFEPSNPTSSWCMPQPVAWTAHRFDGRLVPPRAESRGTALRHTATSVDAASTRWQAVANGSTWCPRCDELSPYSLSPPSDEANWVAPFALGLQPAGRRQPGATSRTVCGCVLRYKWMCIALLKRGNGSERPTAGGAQLRLRIRYYVTKRTQERERPTVGRFQGEAYSMPPPTAVWCLVVACSKRARGDPSTRSGLETRTRYPGPPRREGRRRSVLDAEPF